MTAKRCYIVIVKGRVLTHPIWEITSTARTPGEARKTVQQIINNGELFQYDPVSEEVISEDVEIDSVTNSKVEGKI